MTKKSVILCVDDEVSILVSLREQLSDYFGDQYQYELAESPEEAWEVLNELQLEDKELAIVISDWLMPGTKGDEFLIAVNQKFPQALKLMLTGQASEEAVKRAQIEANLHTCLRKPWRIKELINAVESAIPN
jgi:CheY-like chemotaxis protein